MMGFVGHLTGLFLEHHRAVVSIGGWEHKESEPGTVASKEREQSINKQWINSLAFYSENTDLEATETKHGGKKAMFLHCVLPLAVIDILLDIITNGTYSIIGSILRLRGI